MIHCQVLQYSVYTYCAYYLNYYFFIRYIGNRRIHEMGEDEEEEENSSICDANIQQTWGKLHPDRRPYISSMRVAWSDEEVRYVRAWITKNPSLPVRCLYDNVHCCPIAREIFHSHHVDLDKIAYMFKRERHEL